MSGRVSSGDGGVSGDMIDCSTAVQNQFHSKMQATKKSKRSIVATGISPSQRNVELGVRPLAETRTIKR